MVLVVAIVVVVNIQSLAIVVVLLVVFVTVRLAALVADGGLVVVFEGDGIFCCSCCCRSCYRNFCFCSVISRPLRGKVCASIKIVGIYAFL